MARAFGCTSQRRGPGRGRRWTCGTCSPAGGRSRRRRSSPSSRCRCARRRSRAHWATGCRGCWCRWPPAWWTRWPVFAASGTVCGSAKEQTRRRRPRAVLLVGRGGVPGGGHPPVPARDQPPALRPRGAAVQRGRVQRARSGCPRVPGRRPDGVPPSAGADHGGSRGQRDRLLLRRHRPRRDPGLLGPGPGRRRPGRGHGGVAAANWWPRRNAAIARCRGGTPSCRPEPTVGALPHARPGRRPVSRSPTGPKRHDP